MREAAARAGIVWQVSWQAHADLSRWVLALTPGNRLLAIATAVSLKLIVNAVLEGSRTEALAYCGLLATLQAVMMAGGRMRHRTAMASTERLRQEFDRQLVSLTSGMPGIRHYEEPQFVDDLETLRSQPQVLGNAFITLVQLCAAALELLIIIAILATVHPLLGLLPVISVPLLLARVRAQRLTSAAWTAGAPLQRQVRHLFTLLTSPEGAKEVRVSQHSEELLRRHAQTSSAVERLFTRADIRAELLAAVGWLTSGLLYAAAVYFVVHQAIRGRASVGDVLLTLALAGLVTGTTTAAMETLSRYLQADDLLKRLVRLREHAAADHATGSPVSPAPVPVALSSGITLDGVGFRYPGSSRAALEDVSLHLPAGSVVAVVGDNGAGKSTLVALLTRLYEPSSGAVSVDEVPLASLDTAGWRRRLSGAFQDFARFELAARETVGVGDLSRLDEASAVEAALSRAGASTVLAGLPSGLDSQLGTSFADGVQLSGGQWQKLALGRGLMLEAPLLLVLDEPTANLDPIAEQALHERCASTAREWAAAAGTITLLVSHRFSTVRTADLIVVLREGRLVEHGSHHELMAAKGLYAELYSLQARGYR